MRDTFWQLIDNTGLNGNIQKKNKIMEPKKIEVKKIEVAIGEVEDVRGRANTPSVVWMTIQHTEPCEADNGTESTEGTQS